MATELKSGMRALREDELIVIFYRPVVETQPIRTQSTRVWLSPWGGKRRRSMRFGNSHSQG